MYYCYDPECPIAGNNSTPYKTRSGLSKHIRSFHRSVPSILTNFIFNN